MESDSSFKVVIDNPRLLSSCVQLRSCLWPTHQSACLLLCPEDDVICTSFLPVGVLAEAGQHSDTALSWCSGVRPGAACMTVSPALLFSQFLMGKITPQAIPPELS